MSTIQRRNSQRLASALEALTSDLDMDVTASEVETDENIVSAGLSPQEYMRQDGRDYGDNGEQAAMQYLGQDEDDQDFKAAIAQLEDASDCEQQTTESEDDQDFQAAFAQAMEEAVQEDEVQESEQEEVEQASIEQGDPGVDDFGSEETFDTDNVRQLGSDYGVDFDGDEDLQDTIRNVPGRTQKQAKIKKLIARIENVANHLEKTGRKKLAYRLDVVCNNLEAKYFNK